MTDQENKGIELDFDDLANLFVKLGSSLSPTYLHGSIAGVLSAGKRMNQETWVDWALDQIAASNDIEDDHVTIIQGLYFKTLTELEDPGLAFNMILPDDQTPMVDRLQSLSEWAGSFLGAFGASGTVHETSDLPATIQEILEDLSEIAQVDATSGEELSSSELDFMAVVEHVRVSAITVYLEYNKPPAAQSDDKMVH